MQESEDDIDWRAVAAEFRSRLHSICLVTALALYAAMGFSLQQFLGWLRVDDVWVETIAMIAWLPLGVAAMFVKVILSRWADQGVPKP